MNSEERQETPVDKVNTKNTVVFLNKLSQVSKYVYWDNFVNMDLDMWVNSYL